jgi:hypothetical protein
MDTEVLVFWNVMLCFGQFNVLKFRRNLTFVKLLATKRNLAKMHSPEETSCHIISKHVSYAVPAGLDCSAVVRCVGSLDCEM